MNKKCKEQQGAETMDEYSVVNKSRAANLHTDGDYSTLNHGRREADDRIREATADTYDIPRRMTSPEEVVPRSMDEVAESDDYNTLSFDGGRGRNRPAVRQVYRHVQSGPDDTYGHVWTG